MNVLEKIRTRFSETEKKASERYQKLVLSLAAGRHEETGFEAEEILSAAGKSVAELEADVARRAEILQLRKTADLLEFSQSEVQAIRRRVDGRREKRIAEMREMERRHAIHAEKDVAELRAAEKSLSQSQQASVRLEELAAELVSDDERQLRERLGEFSQEFYARMGHLSDDARRAAEAEMAGMQEELDAFAESRRQLLEVE